MTQSPLTNSLVAAGNGSRPEIEIFFKTLINSRLYIPAKRHVPKNNPILGESSPESLPYLFVDYEEHSCIPVFSEEVFLTEWAEREIIITDEEFKTFIWRIPQNTWLYLNPNQEVGKEISPWEIELLKQGEDTIPDLVDGVIETEQEDIEIESPPDELMPLTVALVPVLEIYKELEEAYLLCIREVDSNSPRALVGIKYSSPLPEDKQNYIRKELERTAEEHLIRPFTGIFVVDDLGLENSMNQTLFLDAAPFYRRKQD